MTNTTKNTKKKTSKKMIPQSNVFAFGGDWAKMDASQKGGVASGVLGGVTSLAGSAISNLAVPDVENQQITANSNDSLISQMSSYKPIEIEKTNAGGSALSGAASGASAGMAFGPWGAAVGGLVGGLSGGISALIGNKRKEEKEQLLKQQQFQGFTSKANEIGNTNFNNNLAQSLAMGGSIHINPANKGKFTASAKRADMGVQEFASHVLANKEEYSPLLVKRANFAHNAAGWQHAEGGELNTFENGGTHEQNPNGGIPQGVDDNGTPNLVEQGESKYKNYIFSDRLKYNKKNTFSDMAKNFSKESKERPNDPISKRGLEANLGKLRQSQDLFKAIQGKSEPNSFAKGGNLFLDGGPFDTNLGQYNLSPKFTVPFSLLLPEATTKVTPKVTTKGTKITKVQVPNTTKVITPVKPTFGFTPDTDYSQQEIAAQIADIKKYDTTKKITSSVITPTSTPNIPPQKADYSTLLRYAPALASGVASITDALGVTNKPDYTAANEMDALNVKGERLGNYLAYNPLDQNYFTNQLGANAASTRAGLRGASGGNRATYMAGLLGSDANYNEGLGKLARQATESNMAQKQQVEGFNRGTNQFNAQQSNWEQGINLQNRVNAIGLREQARQNSTNAKMTNLNNFVESVGGVGQENMYRNMIQNNPALAYKLGILGNLDFKNGQSKKNGGKLKIKNIKYGW